MIKMSSRPRASLGKCWMVSFSAAGWSTLVAISAQFYELNFIRSALRFYGLPSNDQDQSE